MSDLLAGPADPARQPATPTRRRGWGSSPTPPSASAARRARWRARSGTPSPRTGCRCSGCPTTTPGCSGADTWRHVAFIEQPRPTCHRPTLGMPAAGTTGPPTGRADRDGVRWLMASDVCKHCTHAACLDVCPTGSLFRTEFGTVVVQEDICNGCGYCVPACPYGVIDQRKDDGRVWKCTLCYDRLERRPDSGVRQGMPDGVDPVRGPRRAARAGTRPRSRSCTTPASRRPGCTATTRTTASAAPAPSSCCSTSRRSTACRPTPSSPPATSRRCGSTPRWPPPGWRP